MSHFSPENGDLRSSKCPKIATGIFNDAKLSNLTYACSRIQVPYTSLTHNPERASCLLAEIFQYNSLSASKTSSRCYLVVAPRGSTSPNRAPVRWRVWPRINRTKFKVSRRNYDLSSGMWLCVFGTYQTYTASHHERHWYSKHPNVAFIVAEIAATVNQCSLHNGFYLVLLFRLMMDYFTPAETCCALKLRNNITKLSCD